MGIDIGEYSDLWIGAVKQYQDVTVKHFEAKNYLGEALPPSGFTPAARRLRRAVTPMADSPGAAELVTRYYLAEEFDRTANWFCSMGIEPADLVTIPVLADTPTLLAPYSYGRGSEYMLGDPVNGTVDIQEGGMFQLLCQVVYNLGNQDVDVTLSFHNSTTGEAYLHTRAMYGKGGIGDSIVLAAYGELTVLGNVDLRIGCSDAATFDIIEADFGIMQVADFSRIVWRYP